MSVPMVELAHVEALWAHVPAREEDLQALRDSAVPGADAHETAVILPAGWVFWDHRLTIDRIPYQIIQVSNDPFSLSVYKVRSGDPIGENGRFGHSRPAKFPSLQSAVDALKAALEGGA